MNKSAELAVLDEAIFKLGKNSYLGPWLAEIRSEVEACVKSDIYPTISLHENSLRRDEVIKEAREEAGKIVASANRKAEQIVASANRKEEQIESVARAWRKEAAEKLRHLAATLA
jgi:vacuolar-type H+-ATPase subunit H